MPYYSENYSYMITNLYWNHLLEELASESCACGIQNDRMASSGAALCKNPSSSKTQHEIHVPCFLTYNLHLHMHTKAWHTSHYGVGHLFCLA